MKKNLGSGDRVFRLIGAVGLLVCAFVAPLAQEIRLPLFGLMGFGLLFTALSGSCAFYRLLGKSTCQGAPQ